MPLQSSSTPLGGQVSTPGGPGVSGCPVAGSTHCEPVPLGRHANTPVRWHRPMPTVQVCAGCGFEQAGLVTATSGKVSSHSPLQLSSMPLQRSCRSELEMICDSASDSDCSSVA